MGEREPAAFAVLFTDALQGLSAEATANALVSAAECCLSLRLNPAVGRLIASQIEDPRGLPQAEAESLYFRLENLYFAAMRSGVETQMNAMVGRYYETFAEQYRQYTANAAQPLAAGYGILMIRLLATMRSIPTSVLDPIQARLTVAAGGVDKAVERLRIMNSANPDSKIAWSPEVVDYLRWTARLLATVCAKEAGTDPVQALADTWSASWENTRRA